MIPTVSKLPLYTSLVGLLVLCLPAAVLAETKIGFVNAARVLEEAPQADAAREQLEKEFAPRDKEIVNMQNDLKKLEEKLARDGAVMSESERSKVERDVLSFQRDIKRKKEEFREDLNIRRNEAFERLRKRVFEVIVKIAEEKKFDLIVSDGVVFASKRIDITNEVVEKLKSELSAPKK
ncbi:MAG: OmpH family outer membrane protein [Gammaproteobacteria bacterium]|nr:OmpH family outer membrane protein [Gammaproteobacteria bacterium]